ncbi:xanthine dehydrogenase family protein molybdopterin-binding subunit [Roseomonas sp. OT10]|uniref:xanthine dehydrogenase family protein molybdopterin-binding subunit n=1 Tax=Roseomonas cutis TaxID=2897332 RepID=UPI001E47CC30|nr:xanthine dehydrogenase family protein molybdopterin-binding subunit [Roseomonas sp. OT10]UFN46917.1 xanthine dehydrogenase family protein molybdopterin-binding subunit [Roseomonas sp. OT10]
MPDTHLPDPTRLKFGIGQPVPRNEDPYLLRGEGRYTDDLHAEGQAYACIVRSPHPHGVIRGIGLEAARAMPGVLGAWSGADLAAYGPLKCTLPLKNRDGSPMRAPERPSLATDKVRYVGDPVAFVVAETPAQAKDAAEMVELDIEPLDAVTDAEAAAQPGAPLLYDGVPGNVVLDFLHGDAAKVEAAFRDAAHTVRLQLTNNRVAVCPMEPRSAIAEYDASRDHWTLRVGCQGVFGLRRQLAADVLKVPVGKLRVLTGNVGGSFGMKASAYPEYACLFHAARELGRPVKWTDERTGAFVSDMHGRAHEVTGELALDAEGRFLAVRLTAWADMGGYLSTMGPNMGTMGFVRNVQSNYATPLIQVATKCVFTNTTPIAPYRGAGRPEGNYFMERLIEAAARTMGKDPLALRRLNHIRPEQMPYAAASGSTYDGGEFSALLEKALEASDWDGFAARRAESEARGLLRGRGLGNYLECTAPPTGEMGGLRFNEDGTVTIVTGTLDYGQGHWTPFAQVLTEKLGVPFEAVRLVQGDSDLLVAGGGTGGSKSLMASGAAIVEASDKAIEKGREAASHLLEAAAADIEFDRREGRFAIAGTDRGIGILELAARMRQDPSLPEGLRSLDVTHVIDDKPMAYPNGCHVAEVEVDPETGHVQVVRYAGVNDFGVVVNPLLVAGQAHGGIAQGIGQALMERIAYDESGQILSASFMDYALPRAEDVPFISLASRPVPARTNPLGAKGCGEAGCAGSLPAVMNALADALASAGAAPVNMPATPEKVWLALQAAKG